MAAGSRSGGRALVRRRRGRHCGVPAASSLRDPRGLAGRASDWRDLLGRLALTAGALLLAGLAAATAPARLSPPTGYRPVASWARRWAYAAVLAPVVGWALPHGLWVAGIPFGISAEGLDDIRQNLDLPTAVAVTFVPPLAGLLALGLVQRWGQQFPAWVPLLGSRRVPRLLALIPASTVSLALVFYGVLSATAAVGGTLSRADWAVFGTLFVFAGWGVALGVTTAGYYAATRA
ncbi:hypothetical protein JIG36_28910 [Actinoplanes sp. LDG1-06]|uniref:Uncharacterized protein n=1 Tax=Paractinoplanes ovalisporus TaxID=2810368 RepID=A0ABS2AIB1_9ACTN|nr:hypothetical protein [Actinoplanes ovalisporus]MBM2619571.1 hypothetical protein [Actinoplanes ovalisporus]